MRIRFFADMIAKFSAARTQVSRRPRKEVPDLGGDAKRVDQYKEVTVFDDFQTCAGDQR